MQEQNLIPTGYEPKTQNNATALYHPLANMRISDSLIKVLPEFSHSLLDRKRFREAFADMLKGIQGQFMMVNVRVARSELGKQQLLAAPASEATAPPGVDEPTPTCLECDPERWLVMRFS